MANKKECDRCKTLGDSGTLRNWGSVEVKNIDGNRDEGQRCKDLCPSCKAQLARFLTEPPPSCAP